jgi:hypothetical protein
MKLITTDILQDPTLIDEVSKKRIAIEKGENWGYSRHDKDRSYDLYWGPVDKDDKECVSDYIYIKNEWFKDILDEAGVTKYSLNDSENHHTLYMDNDEQANASFKTIVKILKDKGFKIVRDCY